MPSDDFENVTIYLGSDGIATDLKWAYYDGHKMNYDKKGNQIIDSIDIATFEVTNYIDCRDKLGCISVVKGRVDCDDNARVMPIKAVKPNGKEIE